MLALVLACYVGAVLTALVAPFLLTVGRWQLLHPRAALMLWFGAFFFGACLALVGLGMSILGAVVSHNPAHVVEGVLLSLLAWAGLTVLGAGTAFLSSAAMRLAAKQREAVEALSELAGQREERDAFTLVWLRSRTMMAYAAPGRRPAIFLSSALSERLSAPQVQAVLTHEYTHLRQGHAWATRVAELNAMCLPWARGSQNFRRATKLLVELAADDASARQAGPAHLANALTQLAISGRNEGLHWRARRLASKRWPRPSRRHVPADVRLPVAPTSH